MKFEKRKNTSEMPKKVVNAMTFIVVLIVFIAVLGGIAFWAYIMINKEAPEDSSDKSNINAVKFSDDDIRNILFIITDNNKAQAQRALHGVLVLGIHPDNGTLSITSFPVETMIEEAMQETPLKSIYSGKGIGGVKTALHKLTGSTIHNTAEINLNGVEKIIKYYSEGIVFNVPEALDYTGSPPIKMVAGEQTLSSTQVSDLLRYPAENWSGGSLQKAKVVGGAMKSFVDKYFTDKRFEQADTDFAKVINMVTSDINIAEFHELKPALEFLVKSKDKKITVLEPAGDMTGEGDSQKFFFKESFFAEYQKAYGKTK